MCAKLLYLCPTLYDPMDSSLPGSCVRGILQARTLETQVQFLGWEDPLEMERAIHSSTLFWEIPRIEEPGGLKSMGSQESDLT